MNLLLTEVADTEMFPTEDEPLDELADELPKLNNRRLSVSADETLKIAMLEETIAALKKVIMVIHGHLFIMSVADKAAQLVALVV